MEPMQKPIDYKRPRRSVCQYINIHMDKLMQWVVETPMN